MKHPQYYTQTTDTPINEIDLGHQLGILFRRKKTILAAMVAGALLGAVYSLAATPVYRADAMLELQTKQNQILNEVSSLFANEPSPSEAEVELLQSRLVLGKTVDDLALDQTIAPKYTPVVGLWLHNLSSDPDPVLQVASFTVPDGRLNQPFEFTVINNKSYTLRLPDGKILKGEVGKTLSLSDSGKLYIRQILAPEGQRFTLTKHSKLSAIEQLKSRFSVSTKGKTSPILNLGFEGNDPAQVQRILAGIVDNYVQQNRDRDIQMAANGLAFISEELPRLREALQDSENRLNEYRIKTGSLDIPIEARTALESLASIESQITSLRTEEAGLAELYTAEHPSYKAVLDKLKVLENAKATINRQISTLPNTEQEVIRLNRDVETNQATYVQLLNKQQELNILKASAQGNVRVVDHAATAEQPIAPRKKMIILLAALAGSALAALAILWKGNSVRHIRSHAEIEALGIEVASNIPNSAVQLRHSKHNQTAFLLAQNDPSDIAVEAIRALRTNLHFSMLNDSNRTLMITGTTPGVGKSFVSSNLAAVLAQSDKKVLLIDADMRKGYLHNVFNLSATPGLSDILNSSINPADALQSTSIPNLSFISQGNHTKQPTELLMNNRLFALLEWAKQRFDYVLIDTPPVLTVTDAAIIGKIVGSTLLVVRQDHTGQAELEDALQHLSAAQIPLKGVIFNGIKRDRHNRSRYQAYAKYVKS